MISISRRDFIRRTGTATALSYAQYLVAEGQISQGSGGTSSSVEGKLWVAQNQAMEIALNTKSGTVERLTDKGSGEDYCHQNLEEPAWRAGINPPYEVGARIGGLMLIDELRNKTFSDLSDPGEVSAQRSGEQKTVPTFSFDKTYPGAEFIVNETFRVHPDHIRWDVSVRKTRGADRNIRVIQFLPLPLRGYEAWAPIARAPFRLEASWPFAIQYGQSTGGPVGETDWRSAIPMMVFYSQQKDRALCVTSPIEVPTVRIRFLSNTGADADFHWNSRSYPPQERPYLQVSHEYLSVRSNKNLETGLLISAHPADWRPALGWVYSQYRQYFDADPSFYEWDGVYNSGGPYLQDSLTSEELDKYYKTMHELGVRWEELHAHFPWYGLMIPAPEVKSWTCQSHPAPGTTITREKVAAHCRLARKNGIGTFLYYNATEAEHWYARKEFPASIAFAEAGEPVGAFRAEKYPARQACFLMNADPTSAFGKHLIQQAEEMVSAYPDAAGFFWDVYGRSYMFDFAHDDGITMVNNKPIYYLEFMYQRLMRQYIRPLLRSKGMLITANKPVTIASCAGVDGIMAEEESPEEENPAWIAAQSFLGLNRHVMIISRSAVHDSELAFIHCLRYGMFYSCDRLLPPEKNDFNGEPINARESVAKKYGPFIQLLRAKRWIFHPRALELPEYTDGNIFRLRDGSVMITMVSAWRSIRKVSGHVENLEVICRLPDAATIKSAHVSAIDLDESWEVALTRNGDTLKCTVPKHGKASVIILS